MPGLYTGASGLWGGFAGLLYGSSALSTPPGLLADAGGFTPASLFAQGEQGVWYDPSDLTTLFQDAAGTTPVTAVEQPVGLVLDKSKGGVGTNGAKRVNLLNFTEQFDNAAWVKLTSTISANVVATTDPLGGNTADKLQETAATGANYRVSQVVTTVSGVSYRYSVSLKAAERSFALLYVIGVNGGVYVDLTNGTINSSIGSGVTATVSSQSNGWFRVTATFTASSASQTVLIDTANNTPTNVYNGVAGNGIYIWGADLRLASEASTLPTYQRITAGWPSTMAGNHASQSTPTARPVLSALVNLLTYTEQFDNAAWDDPNITPTAAGFSWPYGSSATLWTSTGNFTAVRQAITVTSGVSVKAIFVLKKGSFDWVRLGIFDDALWTGTHNVLVWFNLGTGAKGTSATNGSGTLTNYDISPLGDGWYLCSITASLPATTYSFGLAGVTADGGSTRVTNGTLYGGGADLRPANSGVGLPSYQRVGAATDYDTTGFPLYLRFDGSDDSMATGTITPGIDKVQVFAGVRKQSDAAQAVVAELSATIASNNGTFLLAAPDGATATFGFDSKGTAQVDAVASTLTAPLTRVVTGLADISGDTATIRINGTQADQDTADQGTGNFLAYPLYIGSRAGTSARFNGNLYSLIVRFGANLDATTISNTETWVNGKTLAY